MRSVETGVSTFDGISATTWYGWARVKGRPSTYVEGPNHFFKLLARLSAWRLGWRLRLGRA